MVTSWNYHDVSQRSPSQFVILKGIIKDKLITSLQKLGCIPHRTVVLKNFREGLDTTKKYRVHEYEDGSSWWEPLPSNHVVEKFISNSKKSYYLSVQRLLPFQAVTS